MDNIKVLPTPKSKTAKRITKNLESILADHTEDPFDSIIIVYARESTNDTQVIYAATEMQALTFLTMRLQVDIMKMINGENDE